MAKIQPTVGRVVWYNPGSTKNPGLRLAAHVASVINDGIVNLMVIDELGNPFPARNVPLVHEGECAGGACQWMPYQRGQAAKTDALEPRVEKLEAAFNKPAERAHGEGSPRRRS